MYLKFWGRLALLQNISFYEFSCKKLYNYMTACISESNRISQSEFLIKTNVDFLCWILIMREKRWLLTVSFITSRTHWDTTSSGTSGNFLRRWCRTWLSNCWFPCAIRLMPQQTRLNRSTHAHTHIHTNTHTHYLSICRTTRRTKRENDWRNYEEYTRQ